MTIQAAGSRIACSNGDGLNDTALLADSTFYVAQAGNSLQRYDPDGAALGAPVVIANPTGPAGVYLNALVPLAGGGFAALFIFGNVNAGTHDGAAVRYYDASGAPTTGFVEVATPDGVRKDEYSITATADGGVFVSWSDYSNSGEFYNPLFPGTLDTGGGTGAGRGSDVVGRRVGPTGVAEPADIADGTETATTGGYAYNGLAGNQYPGSNAVFADGRVLSVYLDTSFAAGPGNLSRPDSVSNTSVDGISYRVFGPGGYSAEVRVDSTARGYAERPDAMVLPGGGFAAAFTEYTQTGNATQVVTYGADGSALWSSTLVTRTNDTGLGGTRLVALADEGFAMAYVTAEDVGDRDVGPVIVNANGSVRDRVAVAGGAGRR